MRPDHLEGRLRQRLDALGPAPRAELLHVLMLPDLERADRIGEFWGLKGTETLDRSSSSKFVLMYEATQHIMSSNSRSIGWTRRRMGSPPRRPQVESSMGPCLVVVGSVGAEHLLGVSTTE